MKSFWLLVLLLIPFSARAQERLLFRAQIAFQDTGSWSGFSKWYPQNTYGGWDTATFALSFDDTLSLVGDSISQTNHDAAYFVGAVAPNNDSIRELQLTGGGYYAPSPDYPSYNYTISIESLPLQQLSGSLLAVVPGVYTCKSTSNFSWTHPGGPEVMGQTNPDITMSSGSGTGSGLSVLTVTAANDAVHDANSNDSLEITFLGAGSVQFNGGSAGSIIELFDDLGRKIFSSRFEGNSVRISDLNVGCYFVRTGSKCMKFFVSR